jgi:hypothetical protein
MTFETPEFCNFFNYSSMFSGAHPPICPIRRTHPAKAHYELWELRSTFLRTDVEITQVQKNQHQISIYIKPNQKNKIKKPNQIFAPFGHSFFSVSQPFRFSWVASFAEWKGIFCLTKFHKTIVSLIKLSQI